MRIKYYHLARTAALVTLLVVFTGSMYGRTIERTYPSLVELLPLAGTSILLITFLVLCRLVHKWVAHMPQGFDKRRFKEAFIWTTGIVLSSVLIGEAIVLLPIERIHYIKYGLLAFFVFYGQKSQEKARVSRALAAGMITAFIGCAEETAQIWIPERVFDPRDYALNVSGALFGSLYAWAMTLWPKAMLRDN